MLILIPLTSSGDIVIGGGAAAVNLTMHVAEAAAHQVTLYAIIPNLFTFSHTTSQRTVPQCRAVDGVNYTNLTCNVATIIAKDDTVS